MHRLLIIALLVSLIGWLVLLPVNRSGAEPVPTTAPLIMNLVKTTTSLDISGSASSAAHEMILQQAAKRFFPGHVRNIHLTHDNRTPPGWALVTEMVVRAIAKTDGARANVTVASVSIEGVTTDPVAYEEARQRVSSSLLDGMSMDSNVSSTLHETPYRELCRKRFARVAGSGRVEFDLSADELGLAALPLLDALTEIAVDCPDAIIRVIGHTDSSGNLSANKTLGRARARSVIEYMSGRGLPIERFDATLADSTVADTKDTDALSRRRNRRVDLELIIP